MAKAAAGLVERLVAEAAAAPPPSVGATDVYRFAQSPFAVWCDRFAPPAEKDPVDEFTKLLFEQGRDHEARVLSTRFPHARPVRYATEAEGFRLTLEAMAAGAPAIAGAPVVLAREGLHGRVDLLVRRDDAPSRFGAYHYEVREIKLAKNLGVHHRLQGAFYHRIVSELQGYTPATFALVDRDRQETSFAYDETELLATLRAVRAIHEGERPPAVHGAGLPPWESYTDRCAREARDVSLVAGVGPSFREKLVAGGIRTVEELAAAGRARLTQIRGIGEKTATRFASSAAALAGGRHLRLAPVAFPPVETEIFLDLEGTGAQLAGDGLVEVDYLIGALVRRDGKETYHAFLAHRPEEEGDMFRAFIGWLAEQRGYAIYHWHVYEAVHFRKLASRHGLEPEMHARLFGSMRDLYKDATAAFAFPTTSHSIKAIAPYMGFRWRHAGVNAMGSIALYFEYARDPAANRDKLQLVLDYNEDDCIAMRVAKDWLEREGAATPDAH